MNQTLQTQHRHCSTNPVSNEMLNAIVESAHCAPTSMNAQDMWGTLPDAAIAELTGG